MPEGDGAGVTVPGTESNKDVKWKTWDPLLPHAEVQLCRSTWSVKEEGSQALTHMVRAMEDKVGLRLRWALIFML